jgi:hypothetical protein
MGCDRLPDLNLKNRPKSEQVHQIAFKLRLTVQSTLPSATPRRVGLETPWRNDEREA